MLSVYNDRSSHAFEESVLIQIFKHIPTGPSVDIVYCINYKLCS